MPQAATAANMPSALTACHTAAGREDQERRCATGDDLGAEQPQGHHHRDGGRGGQQGDHETCRPAAAETDPVEPHEEAEGTGRVTGDVHRPVRVGDVVGQPVVPDAGDPVVQGGWQVGRAAGGAEVLVLGVQDLGDPVLAVDEGEAEHPRQPSGVRREQQAVPGQPRCKGT